MKRPLLAPLALPLLAAGCGSEPVVPANAVAPAPVASAPPPRTAERPPVADSYVGRWTGVEGTYLQVSREGDGYLLEMQYDLDHEGRFPAIAGADGLRFTRNGIPELARPTNGDATGLKWLAGKKDCLTVKPGEGYCRG